MAIQECSGCGAQVQPDGTSPCSCVLAAADEVDAAFKGFRPQGRTRSSWRIVGRPPQPVLVQRDEAGRPRAVRRGRGALLGLVMATMLGTLAFVVGAANSGQSQRGEMSPFPSSTGVGVLPRPMEGNAAPPGGEFGKGASPGPSRNGVAQDAQAEAGDGEEAPGSPSSSSAPSSEAPSSPSEGAAGGGSDGGSSDGGSADGGSSDGGTSDGSSEGGSQSPSPSPSGDQGGASDGGSTEGGADGGGDGEESGGLLGGLLGGILG